MWTPHIQTFCCSSEVSGSISIARCKLSLGQPPATWTIVTTAPDWTSFIDVVRATLTSQLPNTWFFFGQTSSRIYIFTNRKLKVYRFYRFTMKTCFILAISLCFDQWREVLQIRPPLPTIKHTPVKESKVHNGKGQYLCPYLRVVAEEASSGGGLSVPQWTALFRHPVLPTKYLCDLLIIVIFDLL